MYIYMCVNTLTYSVSFSYSGVVPAIEPRRHITIYNYIYNYIYV